LDIITLVHVAKTGGTFIRNYFKRIGTELKVVHDIEKRDRKSYTFSFVRNPWEWQVSLYFHMRQSWQEQPRRERFINTYPTFNDYVKALDNDTVNFVYFSHMLELNNVIYSQSNNNKLDFVGKIENIYTDLYHILRENKIIETVKPEIFYTNSYSGDNAGIKKNSPIGHTKHKHYSAYYNNRTIQQVYDNNKHIIKKFNYIFENITYKHTGEHNYKNTTYL